MKDKPAKKDKSAKSARKAAKAAKPTKAADVRPLSFDTLCIQAGYSPQPGDPRVAPIVQSTTYKYDDIDYVNKIMTLQDFGHKYSRTSNPTVAAFEGRLNALEGGTAAVATASGQAANFLAVANIVKAGDHILATSQLYGGTYTLFHSLLTNFGVTASFFDPEASARDIEALVRPETRLIFGETIGNPGLAILDFEKIAKIAQKCEIPFIVDNSLATPWLCQPLKHGANIVTYSATKYIDGHATSLGGAIIDGGNFDWTRGKFPNFTEPDPTYLDIVYTDAFPKTPFLVKARAQAFRTFGPCLSPLNAFLFNIGLETLHLRLPRHCDNALTLAKFLDKHPKVNWVNYPGLNETGKQRIKKYFNHDGGSGILTFGIKGDLDSVRRFVKALKVAALVVHLADARTGVLHPASSTHAQMNEKELRAAGITPYMVRISVGIEDAADLIHDFDQALALA